MRLSTPIRSRIVRLALLTALLGAAGAWAAPAGFEAAWSASSDPVYVGERFYLMLEVISREGSLTKNIRLENLPPTNHLACEPFADLPVEIKAIADQICEIRRFRTIAVLLQPGPCEIRGTLQGTQIRKIQNFFFTQREERNVTIPSAPLTLQALPLPDAHRPPDFSGAIGSGFALSAQLAPTSAVIGDLVTVTIQLRADSPLARFAAPATHNPPNFKSYPLKSEPLSNAAPIQTFTQIIIPLSDQAHTWGPVTFTYFDPRRADYVRLEQGPFELTLLPERAIPTTDYRPDPQPAAGTPRTVRVLRNGTEPGFKNFADLYAQGKYAEALKLPVVDMPATGRTAAEYYNRGCAWLALGLGEQAAAAFRAGQYLEPRATDVRDGFQQALSALGANRLERGFPDSLWDRATRREWAILLAGGIGLLAVGLLIRLRRRGGVGVGIGVLSLGILLCLAAGGGIRYRNMLQRYPEAILTPASTPVSLAPAESALRYTDLPRGTWIRIRERNGDWIRISAESVDGWIPAESAARIPQPAD